MKILLKIFFLFVYCFTFSKTVVVGVYDNPPKIYYENGKPKGFFIELLQEIAKNEKWNLTYYYSTWEDCIKKLEEEKIDILPDVAYSEERARKFDLNKISVLPSWFQVYTREDVSINNFSDLNDKKIIVLKDSIQEEFMDKFITNLPINITTIKVDSYYDAISIINNKKADAVVVSRFFAYSKYRKHLIPTPLILDKTTLHYAVKKNKNFDLLVAIDKNLSKIINNPYSIYYKIILKYLNEDEIANIRRSLFIHFLFFIFLLIISIFLNLIFKHLLNIKTREIRYQNIKLENTINELKKKDEELKNLLKQKEKFLRELKHRTRNNMNIISSMIGVKSLSLNNPTIIEFANDIKEKIWVMGLIHSLIEETEDYSILNIKKFIQKYFKELTNIFPQTKDNLSITLNLEETILAIDIGIPFCFVISELVKSSILKNKKTDINIELFMKNEILTFNYSEANFNEKDMKIIEEIIKKQLYGEIKIEKEKLSISFKNNLYF